MRGRGASEMEMRARYHELHAQLTDETHLESWFRDQVLHPRETQHSLLEVAPVLTAEGMTLVATSINRFAPITSLDALFTQERVLRDTGEQWLRDNRYFPGFFLFLARKNDWGLAQPKEFHAIGINF